MTTTVLPLTELLPNVLPYAPEVPQHVATFNLRMAAIEFCERTNCWRHMTTVNVTRDNQPMIAPPYAAIHRIESARFDGVKLTPIQFSDVDEEDAEASAGTQPVYITQGTYNTVRLIPLSEGTLKLSVFLKPVSGNNFVVNQRGVLEDAFDVIPDFMIAMHAEAIAAGALYRILSQPNRTYSNPGLAGEKKDVFDRAADSSFSVNIEGQHRARRRTRFNDF